ncbi:MAG: hypothetical protein KGO81_10530 [Bacteroidota bacterium]|nr:hypothetical protein [Bacteroidota bacterium]
MKKVVFFSALALILSTGVMAQDSARRAGMKDMRKDLRDIHRDKAERRKEIKEGDKAAAKADTRDIKADKKDVNSDRKELQKEGVKHPVRRAQHQIHEMHEKKNG